MVKEEERLILNDWAAERIAKLIPHIRIHFGKLSAGIHPWIKPVARSSKRIPAPVFVSRTMKSVRSALSYYVNDSAGVASEFGVEVISNDAELLRRIRVRTKCRASLQFESGN